ncbi:MAG: hypothetical protein U9P71_00490 [Campylobacterota bacterium]|nr:hypothetical protein [Campylobacterota bacterium]
MFQTIASQLNNSSKEEILSSFELALEKSNEAPFWAEKTVPFVNAILSVLIPLREQKLLFTPEGRTATDLTSELFLKWCDLVSLKILAFKIQSSNEDETLLETKYSSEKAKQFQSIELEELGTYLSGYMINLENIDDDFPIAHYNLHVGITTVIKGML